MEEQGLVRAQQQEVGHCAVTVCLGLPLCSPDVGGEAAVSTRGLAPLHPTGSRDRKGLPCKENQLASAAQARMTQAPGSGNLTLSPAPQQHRPLPPPTSRLRAFPLPREPLLPSTFSLKERGPGSAFQLSLKLPSLGEEQGPQQQGPHAHPCHFTALSVLPRDPVAPGLSLAGRERTRDSPSTAIAIPIVKGLLFPST